MTQMTRFLLQDGMRQKINASLVSSWDKRSGRALAAEDIHIVFVGIQQERDEENSPAQVYTVSHVSGGKTPQEEKRLMIIT